MKIFFLSLSLMFCSFGILSGVNRDRVPDKLYQVPSEVRVTLSNNRCEVKPINEIFNENPLRAALLIADDHKKFYLFSIEQKEALKDYPDCHCVLVCDGDKEATYLGPLSDVDNNAYLLKVVDALAGDVHGQYEVGLFYSHGNRGWFQQDKEKGFKWYLHAAQQELPIAQFWVAQCYFKGDGVRKDKNEALKWLEKSAQNNFSHAILKLGYYYQKGKYVNKDLEKAFSLFQKAADSGNCEAEYILGIYFLEGKIVPQDLVHSVELFYRSAMGGYMDGQCAFAICLEEGKGVEKNIENAIKWYRVAEQQGHILASYRLALCYFYGRGVDVDKNKAKELLRYASDHGLDEAGEKLEQLGIID